MTVFCEMSGFIETGTDAIHSDSWYVRCAATSKDGVLIMVYSHSPRGDVLIRAADVEDLVRNFVHVGGSTTIEFDAQNLARLPAS